ncbi:sensor histidine kinase, partial [Enterococcus faecium]
ISSVNNSSPSLTNAIWDSKNIFAERLNTDLFWNGRNFIIPFFFLLDIGVLYWRLIRRYRQMQLPHIISDLHYIANGN